MRYDTPEQDAVATLLWFIVDCHAMSTRRRLEKQERARRESRRVLDGRWLDMVTRIADAVYAKHGAPPVEVATASPTRETFDWATPLSEPGLVERYDHTKPVPISRRYVIKAEVLRNAPEGCSWFRLESGGEWRWCRDVGGKYYPGAHVEQRE